MLNGRADEFRAKAARGGVSAEDVRWAERLVLHCHDFAENLGAYRDFPGKYAQYRATLREQEMPRSHTATAALDTAETAYRSGSPAGVRSAMADVEKALKVTGLLDVGISFGILASVCAAPFAIEAFQEKFHLGYFRRT
jgi:hypothetical protein